MRRIAVALATLCLLAGQLIFAGAATGADPTQFTATPLTPDSTFVGAKSTSGAIAQTDPALLGQDRCDPGQRDDQVRLRRDGVVHRRRRGLAATSPRVTGKTLKANAARSARTSDYATKLSDKITAAAQKAVPGAQGRASPTTGATAASRRRCRRTRSPALLKVDGVAAVQQDTLEQPLDDNTAFIGATDRLAVARRLGQRRRERHRRRHRHGHLAGASDARAGRPRRRRPAASRPASSATAPTSPTSGPTFTCNNKLIGAYAKTATYMANDRRRRGRVLQQHDPPVLGRATPRATARTRRRRPPATASPPPSLYGVERGPVCGIAPGARVIMYRVCLAAGLLQLRLGGGRPAGDPRRRRRHQLLDLGRRQPVHRRGRARVPRRVQRRASRSTPRPATAARARRPSDHGGPWVTTVGASTGPRSSARRCTSPPTAARRSTCPASR